MKTVFVCYALEHSHLGELQQRLAMIDQGASSAGWRSYAHVRDEQNWQFGTTSLRHVLDVAFKRISAADAVLLDLTSHANSKRVGLNIEAGYAKALGKPILALHVAGDRPNMTTDLADYEMAYREVGELSAVVNSLLKQVSMEGAPSGQY